MEISPNNNVFEKLDALFAEWQQSFPIDKRKKFCKDGLMLKPGTKDIKERKIEESELWYNSKIRVAFLLKDYTCSDDSWVKEGECITDVREWLLMDENNLSLTPPKNYRKRNIFLDIALILRGIHVQFPYNNLPKGESEISPDLYKKDIDSQSLVKNAIKSIPFCYIETKKEAGTTVCSPKKLIAALNGINADYLNKELAILNSNIIVCFGKDIFSHIDRILFNGQEKETFSFSYSSASGLNLGKNDFSCTLNYYPQIGVFLIDGIHPSSRKPSWIIYEKVISPLRLFVRKHNKLDLLK